MKFDIIKELENELSKVSIKERIYNFISNEDINTFIDHYINEDKIDTKKLDDYIMCRNSAKGYRLSNLYITLECFDEAKSIKLSIKNELLNEDFKIIEEICNEIYIRDGNLDEQYEFLKEHRPEAICVLDDIVKDVDLEKIKEEESGKFYKIECEYDLKCDDKIFHGKVKAIEYAKVELSKLGQNYNDVDEMNLIGYVELTVE